MRAAISIDAEVPVSRVLGVYLLALLFLAEGLPRSSEQGSVCNRVLPTAALLCTYLIAFGALYPRNHGQAGERTDQRDQ